MSGFTGFVVGAWAFLTAALAIVVGWFLAVGVYRDAMKLEAEATSRKTILAPPWVWAAATFVGGILPAVTYWVLHHGAFKGEFVATIGDASSKGPGTVAPPSVTT